MSVATTRAAQARHLAELKERRGRIEAELAKPSELAAELDRLDDAICDGADALDEAEATARREYLRAKQEHEAATTELLDALPGFLDAFERALRARVRVDSAARIVDVGRPPGLHLTKRLDRQTLDRWRRVTARGFNV